MLYENILNDRIVPTTVSEVAVLRDIKAIQAKYPTGYWRAGKWDEAIPQIVKAIAEKIKTSPTYLSSSIMVHLIDIDLDTDLSSAIINMLQFDPTLRVLPPSTFCKPAYSIAPGTCAK